MRNWDVTLVEEVSYKVQVLCDFLSCRGTSLLWWMGPRLVPDKCLVEGWAHVASLSILTEKGYDTFSQEMTDTSLQRKGRQCVCLLGTTLQNPCVWTSGFVPWLELYAPAEHSAITGFNRSQSCLPALPRRLKSNTCRMLQCSSNTCLASLLYFLVSILMVHKGFDVFIVIHSSLIFFLVASGLLHHCYEIPPRNSRAEMFFIMCLNLLFFSPPLSLHSLHSFFCLSGFN